MHSWSKEMKVYPLKLKRIVNSNMNDMSMWNRYYIYTAYDFGTNTIFKIYRFDFYITIDKYSCDDRCIINY